MLNPTVLSFLNKAADPALQARLRGQDVASLVKIAAESGFVFTAEEYQATIVDQSAELSLEQLDNVAGGFNPQPDPPGRRAGSYPL
jgi:predicted ribosomally synthesized peptide with nif11-like leader